MKFNLFQAVTIQASGEAGEVIGRAEYSHAEPGYLVRYKAADGRAVEAWWTEQALVATKVFAEDAQDTGGGAGIDETPAVQVVE